MGVAAGSEPISDLQFPVPADAFRLAASVLKQAIATGDDLKLSGAVARCRRILAASSHDDNQTRSKTLGMLGVALQHRFRRHGAMADLDEAVEVGRRSADLVPEGDPDQVAILLDLAAALKLRFAREGAVLGRRDLDAVVSTLRRAAAATPVGTPEAIDVGQGLCAALGTRFDHYRDPADLAESVSLSRELAASLLVSGQVHAAAELTQRAVAWLAAIMPGSLGGREERECLASFAGLASEAAAVALLDEPAGQTDAKRAELAFGLLEAGRGSLLGHALDLG